MSVPIAIMVITRRLNTFILASVELILVLHISLSLVNPTEACSTIALISSKELRRLRRFLNAINVNFLYGKTGQHDF